MAFFSAKGWFHIYPFKLMTEFCIDSCGEIQWSGIARSMRMFACC